MASPATTLLWLSARASETLIEGSKVEVVLGAPGVLYYRRVSGYVLHWIYYFSLKSPGLTSFTLPATRLQRLIRSINLKVVGSLATRKTGSSFFFFKYASVIYWIRHLSSKSPGFTFPIPSQSSLRKSITLDSPMPVSLTKYILFHLSPRTRTIFFLWVACLLERKHRLSHKSKSLTFTI